MTDPIYKYEVQVAQDTSSGADYDSIMGAIDAIAAGISDWDAPSSSARYCVRVHPGTYVENVSMLSWVDIRGTSKHDTRIAANVGTSASLYVASNVQLEDIIIDLTYADDSSAQYDFGIYGENVNNVHIRNVDLLSPNNFYPTSASSGICLTSTDPSAPLQTIFIEHCVINCLAPSGYGESSSLDIRRPTTVPRLTSLTCT